jgi:F1F0 ATPase subunit 2
MSDTVNLTLALLAGLSLGVVFFGGLWWTVRQGLSARHPAIWLFSSVMLRVSLTLAGFYFIGRGDWARLLVCLGGFLLARLFVIKATPPRQNPVCRQA